MSDALHVLPPFILAAVLIASGVAKLRHPDDLDGWRELGVPAALRRTWLLKLHPWGEIALAVVLVVFGGVLGLLAALVAVALMAVYLVLVWRVLRQPEDASCACFGEKRPVTRVTVVRNAWLTLIAVFAASVIWQLPLWGGALVAAGPAWGWVLGAAVAAVTAVLVVQRDQPSAREARDTGPAAGDAIGQPLVNPTRVTSDDTQALEALAALEAFGLEPLLSVPRESPQDDVDDDEYRRARTPAVPVTLGDGKVVNLRHLSMARPRLILAVSESCGSCVPVIEAADGWRVRLPEVVVHLLLTSEPGASGLTSSQEPHTLHDPHQYVRGSIADWQTPSAVLLGGDGLLAGGPVTGFAEISAFIDDIEESLAEVRNPFGA